MEVFHKSEVAQSELSRSGVPTLMDTWTHPCNTWSLLFPGQGYKVLELISKAIGVKK